MGWRFPAGCTFPAVGCRFPTMGCNSQRDAHSQVDAHSQLLPRTVSTPSSRDGCSANSSGSVWHRDEGSGIRESLLELGGSRGSGQIGLSCSGLRFDRAAFLPEGIWLCHGFLQRSGQSHSLAAWREGCAFGKVFRPPPAKHTPMLNQK